MAATIRIELDDPNAGGTGPTPAPPPGGPGMVLPIYDLPALNNSFGKDSDLQDHEKIRDILPVYVTNWEDMARKGGGPGSQPREKRDEGWVKFLLDRARGGVAAAGVAASGVAQNSAAPALGAAVDAASAGLARLGPKGMAAAAALQVASTAVTAFQSTVNAFVARGRELAGLNGQIAGSVARADANRYMADVREANELGPQFARLIEQQEKAEATTRELLLPIKAFLMDFLSGAINQGLQMLLSVLEGINGLLPIGAKIDDTVKRIRDIINGDRGPVDPVATWLNALGGFAAPAGPPAAAGPLAAPLPVPRGFGVLGGAI